MINIVLVLILGATFAKAADFCVSSNHFDAWRGRRTNQGEVGSCHSFATAALAEARWWQETGESKKLSEKDLFIEQFFLHPPANKVAMALHHLFSEKIPSINQQLLEQGDPLTNWQVLTRQGVCLDIERPYDFYKLKKGREDTALAYLFKIRSHLNNIFRETKDHIGEQYVKEDFREYIESARDGISANPDFYHFRIHGLNQRCKNTRLDVLSRFQNRELVEITYDNDSLFHILVNRLRCQPILATFKNYKELLNQKSHEDNIHAVVLAGYDCKKNEFLVKNSWGKVEERIPKEKAMRNLGTIYQIVGNLDNKLECEDKPLNLSEFVKEKNEYILALENHRFKFRRVGEYVDQQLLELLNDFLSKDLKSSDIINILDETFKRIEIKSLETFLSKKNFNLRAYYGNALGLLLRSLKNTPKHKINLEELIAYNGAVGNSLSFVQSELGPDLYLRFKRIPWREFIEELNSI